MQNDRTLRKFLQTGNASSPTYNMQERRQTWTQQQQRYNQLAKQTNTKKTRNLNEEETNNNQEEPEETVDPEATCYIKVMMKD